MLTVEINLFNLNSNLEFLRSKVGEVCAVVKADAYGHGAEKIAKSIRDRVKCFAVATKEEGLKLYNGGIKKDIIVFTVENFAYNFPPSIIPTVIAKEQVDALPSSVNRVCIKVNTGMNRYGCDGDTVKSLYDYCVKKGKTVHSVYSHLYNPVQNDLKLKQYEKFINAIKGLNPKPLFHLCASNALVCDKTYYFDFVRAGISLYGYGHERLKPVMKVYTTVVQKHEVKKGESIGYGYSMAKNDMKIAVLRMGYADGLRRNSKGVFFKINGYDCPIVGNACMDACFVDISNAKCEVGDKAYYIYDKKSMENICRVYDTIEYEILTAIKTRAEIIYIERKE